MRLCKICACAYRADPHGDDRVFTEIQLVVENHLFPDDGRLVIAPNCIVDSVDEFFEQVVQRCVPAQHDGSRVLIFEIAPLVLSPGMFSRA